MMNENQYQLGIDQIQRFLPHRSPFLLVDRVLEIHPTGDLDDMTADDRKLGIKVTGLKNVSFNEPYFQGHFPGFAIVPGVLLLETAAQVASFSIYPYMAKDIDKLARDFQCIFVGVDQARFRRPVVPGDTLIVQTVVSKCRGRLWGFEAKGTVDGKLVFEVDILANLISNSTPILGK